jgi:methionyl-tRNA formyltransferase
MTPQDLAELSGQDCEALIVASYKWKIPDWSPFVKCAVNFHCSPLPVGRGPYPLTTAIMKRLPSWGVTCHQVTSEFDKGDILATEKFSLNEDECHDSLDLKIQMAAKRLAKRVASNFVELWEQAEPQEEGSYWPATTLADNVIDFRLSTGEVMLHIRAYGSNGSLALLRHAWLVVKRAVGWTEPHKDEPGEVVHRYGQTLVVATADGYVGLVDYTVVPSSESE